MSSRRSDDPGACLCFLAPAETLELLAGLIIEAIADAASGSPLFLLAVNRRPEVCEKEPRRQLAHFLAGHPAHGVVGRDDAYELVTPILSGKPLQEIVRMSRIADGERPDLPLLAGSVEDRDPARAPLRDEAREGVDEILGARELARVEHVVSVEEVESRIGHCSSLPSVVGEPRHAFALQPEALPS